MKTLSQIWWEDITGPSQLVKSVLGALLKEQSLVLCSGTDFPWRWPFRGTVETKLLPHNLQANIIDCADDCITADPMEFLVRHFAPEKYPDFLQYMGSKAQFLKEQRIFARQIIWLKGVPEDQREAWLQCVRQYKSKSHEEGLFLLELDRTPSDLRPSKSTMVLTCSDYVTQPDLLLFSSILAAKYNVPVALRTYFSALVAELCITDAEVADFIFQQNMLAEHDPLEVLQLVLQKHYGDTPRGLLPPHPFAFFRSGDEKTLRKRIWKAQLRVAFPILEFQRLVLIEAWHQEIEEALHTEYIDKRGHCGFIRQLGNEVQDAYELELGTLTYMTGLHRRNDHESLLLYLPDRDAYCRLLFLHKMRNALAHIYSCINCTPEEMCRLLTIE